MKSWYSLLSLLNLLVSVLTVPVHSFKAIVITSTTIIMATISTTTSTNYDNDE